MSKVTSTDPVYMNLDKKKYFNKKYIKWIANH